MNLNKELRTPKMNLRLHTSWVIFYILLIASLVSVAIYFYNKHDDDILPPGNIELKVSKERYQPGEVVKFSVTNHFPSTIHVPNSCPEEPLNVYKWNNDEWVQIHDQAKDKDSTCYRQPRRVAIEAESTLQYDYSDWPNLFANPGVYRIVMEVEHYENYPFQDFVILEKRKTIESEDNSTPSEPEDSNNYQENENTEEEEHEEDEEDEPEEIEVEEPEDD